MEISAEQMVMVRDHLRVDNGIEEALISSYVSAAVDYVEQYCDGELVKTITVLPENAEPPREVLFTPGIWQAMLLLIGHWYTNREAAGKSQTELPLGVDALLYRHRRWR